MRMALEAADCTVIEAEHGAAALDLIQTSTPTVLVTDITMPVMNGLELMQHVRAHPDTSKVRIVAISADSSAIESEQVNELADVAIDKIAIPTSLVRTVLSLPARAA